MSVETSILRTIRKLIGGDVESNDFDTDLIIAINTALSELYQLGVEFIGNKTERGFVITGESETWDEYLGDYKFVEMVKSYVYLKVRLLFDPPQNSFLVNSIQDQIKELSWRITVAIETDNKN